MSKTAIVTGGSSGIGYATAERLVQQQFRVFLLSRDSDRGRSAARRISETAAASVVHHVVCDVRSMPSVAAAIAEVRTHTNQVELLVNSAGVLRRSMLGTSTEQDIDDQIDTCLKGTVHVTGAAVELLAAADAPLIVNVGSVAAKTPFESLSVYGAAKAGVVQFSRIAAKELFSRGIRVVCVNPGVVRTALMSAAEFSMVQATLPGGRLQEAQDIAALVVNLSDNAYSSMTGAVIDMDDGAGLFSGGPPAVIEAASEARTASSADRSATISAVPDAPTAPEPALTAPEIATGNGATAKTLATIFERIFGIDAAAVGPEVSPETVFKWDSIGHIRLVGAIEETLGVTFDVDEIMELTSVGAILDILERKAA